MDVNISSQIVVQTAAQWAVDATVYSAKRILVVSDLYFGATDQRKYKIADGTQTFANLDYMPLSGYDDATSSIQTQLNGKAGLTSPTFITDITTPMVIGGTAEGSNIIYKSSAGAGTTIGIAHQFTGGTNGATVIATAYNDGQFLVGGTTRTATSLANVRFTTGSGATAALLNEIIKEPALSVPVNFFFTAFSIALRPSSPGSPLLKLKTLPTLNPVLILFK